MRRFVSLFLGVSYFFQIHSHQSTYTPYSASVYILDRVTGRTGILIMPRGKKIRIAGLMMSMEYAYMGVHPGGRAYSAFIQIWDVSSTSTSTSTSILPRQIYSSWMRAGCQNLGTPFVHPRYTIWLKECIIQ